MKITKLLLLKIFICSYILTICTATGSLSSFKMNTHFSLKKNKLNNHKSMPVVHATGADAPPKNLTADDLPEVPVYLEGWVKYFTFTKGPNEKSNKPKFFFKNDAFLTQEKESNDENKEKEEEDEVSNIIN